MIRKLLLEFESANIEAVKTAERKLKEGLESIGADVEILPPEEGLIKTFEAEAVIAESEEVKDYMQDTDNNWLQAETAKVEERKAGEQAAQKAVRAFAERAQERAAKMPDTELPSLVRVQDKYAQADYKLNKAAQELAAEEGE